MFTFHALSRGLSPGFVSLCPFPNKERSILLTNPSISGPQRQQPGICVYPLYCISAFTKGHRRLFKKKKKKSQLLGVLSVIFLHCPCKIPGYHRQYLIFLSRGPLFLRLHPNFPLPKASGLGSPTSSGPFFPRGLQHPPLAKKETTRLENKPNSEQQKLHANRWANHGLLLGRRLTFYCRIRSCSGTSG